MPTSKKNQAFPPDFSGLPFPGLTLNQKKLGDGKLGAILLASTGARDGCRQDAQGAPFHEYHPLREVQKSHHDIIPCIKKS
jgi:hypothetical protein